MGKGNATPIGEPLVISFVTGDLIVFIEGDFDHKWLKGDGILHVSGSVALAKPPDVVITPNPDTIVIYNPAEFFAQFKEIHALSVVAKERSISKQN